MASDVRQLLVSAEQCIGCRACAAVCPAELITLSDSDHRRILWFAAQCGEDCDRCVTACPTNALDLRPAIGVLPGEGTELRFELSACAGCGAPVATAQMLIRLRRVIPTQVEIDAEGQAWLDLCPRCRQQLEARRVAQEGIVMRWAG